MSQDTIPPFRRIMRHRSPGEGPTQKQIPLRGAARTSRIGATKKGNADDKSIRPPVNAITPMTKSIS